jgi:hypothetical protein
MALKKITKITNKQIAEKGVQALADRPNLTAQYGASGLSAAQLKLWFDKLATFLAERINEISDAISSDEATNYIRVCLDEYGVDNLGALITAFTDGNFAAKILQLFPSAGSEQKQTLQAIINGIAMQISNLKEVTTKIDNLKNGAGENSVQQKGTTAGFANQMTVGKNNANKNNTLFEVGNGMGNTARRNAFEVLRDGRAKVYGEPTEEMDVVRLKDLETKLSLIKGIRAIEPVETLPTENISETTLYLVASGEDAGNEYIYVNGAWELIGTTKVDLSNYVTLDSNQIITKLKTFSGGLTLLDRDGLFERVETFHTAKSIHRYIYDGWGEIRSKCTFEYPEKGSGEYTFATTDDVAMVETKTEENAETIKFHEKVLFQSGIVGVLEKSQAYTARETAEGANIVDGQKTSVLEIAGDTVKSSNLFYVNGYNEAWNELSITFDESTQEFTINGTVAKRGNIPLSSSFKIANVSSAKTYTVAIIKSSGSVTFPASGSNSILLSVFDKNNANSYMPSRVTLSQSSPNVVSVAMATAGIDATDLIFYMQLVNSDLGEFVFDNYKFKIQIVEGSYDTNNLPAYSPYFAGLKNAFINSIKSTGRNLFNEKYFEQLSVISADTYKGENCYRFDPTKLIDVYVPCLIEAGKRVFFSIDVAAPNGADLYIKVVFADGTNSNLWGISGGKVLSEFTTYTNTNLGYAYGKEIIAIEITTYSYTIYKPYYFKNIMISVGENRIDYKPYKEEIYQLPQTLELGKWDKINPQTGELTRASKIIVFDGTESWGLQSSNDNGIYNFQHGLDKSTGSVASAVNSICNLYEYDSARIADATNEGYMVNDVCNFFVRTNQFTTVDEWKAHLAELYASGNPLILEYKLKEPTTETLTDIPKTYTAWKNGSETIIQGETDNSAYGAMPTITQTYFEFLGGEE